MLSSLSFFYWRILINISGIILRALKASKQVYLSRYDKPLLAARCCHVANDLTYFTDNRQTNRQTEGHCHIIKPPHLRAAALHNKLLLSTRAPLSLAFTTLYTPYVAIKRSLATYGVYMPYIYAYTTPDGVSAKLSLHEFVLMKS